VGAAARARTIISTQIDEAGGESSDVARDVTGGRGDTDGAHAHADGAHAHHRLVTPSFELESGERILDFELSYATAGVRDDSDSNVVVIVTSLGSTHHRLDYLVAPGRALDPARWHTIAIDAIGNGRTTSPSTSRRQPGDQFPAFTVRDMVRSQLWLLDERGIDRVRCVVGTSMGGMQALEWARMAPSRVDAIVAMTPLTRTPAWTAAVTDLVRYLFRLGDSGVPDAKGHALVLLELLACSTPAGLQDVIGERDASRVLGELIAEREQRTISTADWIAQSLAYDRHDLADGDAEALSGILRAIEVPALIVVPTLDLFNPDASTRLAAGLMPHAELVEIPTSRGHFVTDGRVASEAAAIDTAIAAFLEHGPARPNLS
jgi:homoserine O-acetyltransferase